MYVGGDGRRRYQEVRHTPPRPGDPWSSKTTVRTSRPVADGETPEEARDRSAAFDGAANVAPIHASSELPGGFRISWYFSNFPDGSGRVESFSYPPPPAGGTSQEAPAPKADGGATDTGAG